MAKFKIVSLSICNRIKTEIEANDIKEATYKFYMQHPTEMIESVEEVKEVSDKEEENNNAEN